MVPFSVIRTHWLKACVLLVLPIGCATSQPASPQGAEPPFRAEEVVKGGQPAGAGDDRVTLAEFWDALDVGAGEGRTTVRKADGVAQLIHAHRGEVRNFYDKALARNPGLSGSVTVRMVIGSKGDILEAEVVESTTGMPGFDTALLERIKTWRFPQVTAGEMEGTYTWGFSEGY